MLHQRDVSLLLGATSAADKKPLDTYPTQSHLDGSTVGVSSTQPGGEDHHRTAKKDAAASQIIKKAKLFGLEIDDVEIFTAIHMRGDLDDAAVADISDRLLADRIELCCVSADEYRKAMQPGQDIIVVETGLRAGVTDREAAELIRASQQIGYEITAASIGRRYEIRAKLDENETATLINSVLHNEVIERWAFDELAPAFTDPTAQAPKTEHIELDGLSAEELAVLNKSRSLGLDPEEMLVIQSHFKQLGRSATDAELETLAQTWSEHCAHKTFRAKITVKHPDGSTEEIDGLLKSLLRKATDEIDAEWVKSAFVDNAGIVEFDERFDLALKAETHNHPSALEPFGGANTGVGGVVRDILGVSAKPIALSNILCFGFEDTPVHDVAEGVLHPSQIRDGVIRGIGDYGNKIGVPNIAGAILHDEAYTTTPLVFAGCFGILPTGSNPTEARPGDAIVVLGGAVGRDGIRGATFSSQTMASTTAISAGSAVQIGDPIVEKGLIDVVLAARDAQLYNAITDCGAGGLSSSVGEMAETLGAEVNLELVPRKYPGLAPWEVWLSEAQERMVMASNQPQELVALAHRFGIEATVIGHFTGQGHLRVMNGEESVVDLDCGFLHDGRPQRQMTAVVAPADRSDRQPEQVLDIAEPLLKLLAHPSLRSNEDVVRSYDHEVMGGTIVRPYDGVGFDGPSDGTVTVPPETEVFEAEATAESAGQLASADSHGTAKTQAMVLGIGLNALIGQIDAEAMAWNVIDEAVRNAVVAGADIEQLSLLDNFAWGNPTIPERLGQLVQATKACHDASLWYNAPFVSGKDSLYNEFVNDCGELDPVAPTLVITAVGIARDINVIPSTGLIKPGNGLWLIGPQQGALGASHFDAVYGQDKGGHLPPIDRGALQRAKEVAKAIQAGLVVSAHDVSEGGVLVAAVEMAHTGRLGLDLDLENTDAALFGEHMGRYLLEVASGNEQELLRVLPDAQKVGVVTSKDHICQGGQNVSLGEIAHAYRGHVYATETAVQDLSGIELVDPGGLVGGEVADTGLETPSSEKQR